MGEAGLPLSHAPALVVWCSSRERRSPRMAWDIKVPRACVAQAGEQFLVVEGASGLPGRRKVVGGGVRGCSTGFPWRCAALRDANSANVDAWCTRAAKSDSPPKQITIGVRKSDRSVCQTLIHLFPLEHRSLHVHSSDRPFECQRTEITNTNMVAERVSY